MVTDTRIPADAGKGLGVFDNAGRILANAESLYPSSPDAKNATGAIPKNEISALENALRKQGLDTAALDKVSQLVETLRSKSMAVNNVDFQPAYVANMQPTGPSEGRGQG